MADASPSSGPGMYKQIGKKARELLYKDYHVSEEFALTSFAANGTLQSTITNPDVPGTPCLIKGVLSIPFASQKIGKAELHYLDAHAGISAIVVGRDTGPVANLSGVLGTKALAVGVDVAFDTASGELTKYYSGLTFTSGDLTAALTLNKRNKATLTCVHQVQPSTALGVGFADNFKNNRNTVTFGTQHALDSLTTVTARMNTNGLASASIQHDLWPNCHIAVSTQVNTKANKKRPKLGCFLGFKR